MRHFRRKKSFLEKLTSNWKKRHRKGLSLGDIFKKLR